MILKQYSEEWPREFDALADVYGKKLGGLALSIEHVGSTAIAGIMAKPIIDIDIVIKDYEVFPEVSGLLGHLGYSHNGDQGILHREAFKRRDMFVPGVVPRRKWMDHHLYVCPAFSEELNRHLLFRDHLRRNPAARDEYESIKKEISARSDGDRKTYAAIKENECDEFFSRILEAAKG